MKKYSLNTIFRTMKTTIDIPDNMLKELIRNTETSTKKDAVLTAISEYNRLKRMAQLTDLLGTFIDFMNKSELDKMREKG